MDLGTDTSICIISISLWIFFLWPAILKIISSHFSFRYDIKIQAQPAKVEKSYLWWYLLSGTLKALWEFSIHQQQSPPALLLPLVQTWTGDGTTARTVAWSIHADSTPVVTRPYFVVVGHAGSQNPEDTDNFIRHIHISSSLIALHKVLVYIVQNCHLQTGKWSVLTSEHIPGLQTTSNWLVCQG